MYNGCVFDQDQAARDKALQTMASMSSAQIVSASLLQNKALGVPSFDGFNTVSDEECPEG